MEALATELRKRYQYLETAWLGAETMEKLARLKGQHEVVMFVLQWIEERKED